MNLTEAKTILNQCVRSELRDHAFGDREVYWRFGEKTVAEGYFGGSAGAQISIYYDALDNFDANDRDDAEPTAPLTVAEFSGHEALELAKCGRRGHVERNDSTGPDTYVEGQCLPGLTLEGVKKELCGEGIACSCDDLLSHYVDAVDKIVDDLAAQRKLMRGRR